MQQIIVPSSTLEGLPIEILLEIFSHLTPSHLLQLGVVNRCLKQIVDGAPVWEHIWRKCELKKPARKWKTYLATVLSESAKICERCHCKTKSIGSSAPISLLDEDENIKIRICCNCRCEYYTRHPEPDPEQTTIGQSQVTAYTAYYKQITKGAVISTYKLTSQHLVDLARAYEDNPQLRYALGRNRFYENDVIRLAREVHGGDIGIQAARTATEMKGIMIRESRNRNIESRRILLDQQLEQLGLSQFRSSWRYRSFVTSSVGDIESIITSFRHEAREKEEKRKRMQTRKNELEARLEEVGLTLRADSKICQSYLDHSCMHIDKIVSIMKEQDWYFRCTQYPKCRSENYPSGLRHPYWRWYNGGDPCTDYSGQHAVGKNRALNQWVGDRISRGIYAPIVDDPENNERPPVSLWDIIVEKWKEQLKNYAAGKLNIAFHELHPNFNELISKGEMVIQEEKVIKEIVEASRSQPSVNTHSHNHHFEQVVSASEKDPVNDGDPSSSITSLSIASSLSSITVYNSGTMDSRFHSSISPDSAIDKLVSLSAILKKNMGEDWHQELFEIVKSRAKTMYIADHQAEKWRNE